MIIDFHSHILPMMDDGAKSVSESVEILEVMASQGIDVAVATPHFYLKNEKIAHFLERRRYSFEMLKASIGERKDLPEIVLGAEVAFTPSLDECDLSALCIENTNYLMLEMPYQNFNDSLIRSVENLIIFKNFSPILAHAERCLGYSSRESLYDLIKSDMIVQVNADSIAGLTTRKKAFDVIKNSNAVILGTDVHNLNKRKPKMDRAIKVLKKRFNDIKIEQFMCNAENILKDVEICKILNQSTD